ncbi:hopanoid-associated sugar epimerase [Methylocella silvestris BL2]|uniref:Hopanoid-associated sugar epimerase n=1 Tax=Methylocella silvestris (strain DSM 15510 / CIP 108128 / LMG 27833 / NCIMB 13906 / BL2) TaxID=395965 RepID=B8EQD3_METSB|nr:hopanoid-associated sugar epimerase [Methylocella silvestris]ACK52146.1 hopanoid-associated sugar epimerase [Methylocella silvestris BL2]
MTADTVLVTGASGFVGSAVARALTHSGYSVRALLRPTATRENLYGLDAEIVEGDMCEMRSVEKAMAGARFLFHVAADYRLWARDPGEIVRTNRDGTRVLMQAALREGVERIVYTSSVATIACRDNGAPADESSSLAECNAVGAYKRSKVLAEQIVKDMIVRDQLPAIIVHPSTPVGPRDVRPTPTGRIILEAAMGRMPGYVDTGLNLVHVDDVASGHVAALRRGKIGERYILGGQDVPLAGMLRDIAELCGRHPPWLRLPRALVYPFALAAEAAAHLTHKEPFVTIDGLRMSRHTMFFSSAKAERCLGYVARPYREALNDALNWFTENGRLK